MLLCSDNQTYALKLFVEINISNKYNILILYNKRLLISVFSIHIICIQTDIQHK